MYLDREESKKIKSINGTKNTLKKITKGVAITIALTTILASCSKEKKNIVYNDADNNTEIYEIYENDEIFNELCKEGYLLVKNSNGKYYEYKIMNLLIKSKEKNNLNNEYYVEDAIMKNTDIITHEKVSKYKNPETTIFCNSSIMYKIYDNEKHNLTINGDGKFCIKIDESKLKTYINNWDGMVTYQKRDSKKI